MRDTLAALCEQLRAEAAQTRREAVLQLAMLLERRSDGNTGTTDSPADTFYRSIMAPHLHDIRPTPSEQMKIIAILAHEAATSADAPDMLWAVGKADPALGLGPLLRVLTIAGERFDEVTAYQATIALDNLLITTPNGALAPAVAMLIRATNLRALLQRWASGHDARLAEQARGVAAKIERATRATGTAISPPLDS